MDIDMMYSPRYTEGWNDGKGGDMPKAPTTEITPPKRARGGRTSVRQRELLETLEALKSGEGTVVEDDAGNKFLCLALDETKVPNIRAARAAFYNLRWRYKSGDPEMFKALFGETRGTVRIEEQGGEILVFVPASYARKKK